MTEFVPLRPKTHSYLTDEIGLQSDIDDFFYVLRIHMKQNTTYSSTNAKVWT